MVLDNHVDEPAVDALAAMGDDRPQLSVETLGEQTRRNHRRRPIPESRRHRRRSCSGRLGCRSAAVRPAPNKELSGWLRPPSTRVGSRPFDQYRASQWRAGCPPLALELSDERLRRSRSHHPSRGKELGDVPAGALECLPRFLAPDVHLQVDGDVDPCPAVDPSPAEDRWWRVVGGKQRQLTLGDCRCLPCSLAALLGAVDADQDLAERRESRCVLVVSVTFMGRSVLSRCLKTPNPTSERLSVDHSIG